MSLQSGSGGWTAPRAKRAQWATFGSILPCTRAGLRYQLTKVDYQVRVKPQAISTWVRSVPAANANTDAGEAIGATNGLTPTFTSLGYKPAGTFTRFHRGFTGDTRCKDPAFVEILTSVRYDSAGFNIAGLSVEYRIGSDHHTAHSAWSMAACGTAYQGAIDCAGPPS